MYAYIYFQGKIESERDEIEDEINDFISQFQGEVTGTGGGEMGGNFDIEICGKASQKDILSGLKRILLSHKFPPGTIVDTDGERILILQKNG